MKISIFNQWSHCDKTNAHIEVLGFHYYHGLQKDCNISITVINFKISIRVQL